MTHFIFGHVTLSRRWRHRWTPVVMTNFLILPKWSYINCRKSRQSTYLKALDFWSDKQKIMRGAPKPYQMKILVLNFETSQTYCGHENIGKKTWKMNFIENLEKWVLCGFNIYENQIRQTDFKNWMSLLLTYVQDIHSTRKLSSGFWAF